MQLYKDWNKEIGRKYGKLTILSLAGRNKYGHVLFECLCDCGNKTIAEGTRVTHGGTLSCGCLQKETASKNFSTHRKTNTRLYHIWASIIARCENVNNNRYKNYGGRGICICDEWRKDFLSFYEWALSNGYNDNLSIDRIDVNGNYEPSNCRWANAKEQANNTTKNRYITYQGITRTCKQWAEYFGINYKYFHEKLSKCNWDLNKLLEIPYFRERML